MATIGGITTRDVLKVERIGTHSHIRLGRMRHTRRKYRKITTTDCKNHDSGAYMNSQHVCNPAPHAEASV